MKIYLTLFFFVANLAVFAQKQPMNGNYQVNRIFHADDYYLIFITKNNENYTIYSKKGIIADGQEIKKDSTYYFELIPVPDTLGNGTRITPINYSEIKYFGRFTGKDIGVLCTARNLVGLKIRKIPADCKKKN
jgi:hypothetical protein